MLIIAVLISVLLPSFVHPGRTTISPKEYFWAAQAVMDATKIITISNHRYHPIQEFINPELQLRDPNPDDRPVSHRKRFIRDYVEASIAPQPFQAKSISH
jgi:hypothetical protein